MLNNLVLLGKQNNWELPALFAPDEKTAERILEFFTAQIRNPNTRKAYARATGEFAAWCSEQGISELAQVRPVHVAAYIEGLKEKIAAPSVKLKLAAIRMLFDWLVVCQVVPSNPASSVRGRNMWSGKGKLRCSGWMKRGNFCQGSM
jgi:site-specific recombinase XerD